MANYNDLKTGINAVIKTNGRQEISGAALNTALNNMITELGAGYQYMGVATPATNPGTPDANVFYLASEAGTYTNFGGIVINEGEVCALVWNGTWTKEVTGIATADQLNLLGQKTKPVVLTSLELTQSIASKYIQPTKEIASWDGGKIDAYVIEKEGYYIISTAGNDVMCIGYLNSGLTECTEVIEIINNETYNKLLYLRTGIVGVSCRTTSTSGVVNYDNIIDDKIIKDVATFEDITKKTNYFDNIPLSTVISGKYINDSGISNYADGHIDVFEISKEGYYTFRTKSNDAFRIGYLNDDNTFNRKCKAITSSPSFVEVIDTVFLYIGKIGVSCYNDMSASLIYNGVNKYDTDNIKELTIRPISCKDVVSGKYINYDGIAIWSDGQINVYEIPEDGEYKIKTNGVADTFYLAYLDSTYQNVIGSPFSKYTDEPFETRIFLQKGFVGISSRVNYSPDCIKIEYSSEKLFCGGAIPVTRYENEYFHFEDGVIVPISENGWCHNKASVFPNTTVIINNIRYLGVAFKSDGTGSVFFPSGAASNYELAIGEDVVSIEWVTFMTESSVVSYKNNNPNVIDKYRAIVKTVAPDKVSRYISDSPRIYVENVTPVGDFKKPKTELYDPYLYPMLPTWGNEYLCSWYKKIYNNADVKIVFDGDSITASGYRESVLEHIIKDIAKYPANKIDIINNGIGGISLNEYVASGHDYDGFDMTDFPYGVIDRGMQNNPDLIIIGFGMNDSRRGYDHTNIQERLAYFEANYREALQRIRGNEPVNGKPAYNRPVEDCAIILCTPNSATSSTDNERRSNHQFMLFVRQILQKLCREFYCGFCDFNLVTYDHDFSLDWSYNGRDTIHPSMSYTANYASILQNLVIPMGLWKTE